MPTIISNGGGPTAGISLAEDRRGVTRVVAIDPNPGPVTYSIVGGADQSLFAINATSGLLWLVNAPDFEAPADSDHDNAYVVQVQATAGAQTVNQTITVGVTNENDITGTPGADNLVGGTAAEVFYGLGGNDRYFGDMGNDKYLINIPGNGVVTLSDFWTGTDTIGLDQIGFGIAGNGALALNGVNYVVGTAATTSAPTVIFNPSNGFMSWDADGTGGTAPVVFARIDPGSTVVWAGSLSLGPAGVNFQVVGVGDFNGDGTSDVLRRDATTGQVDLWIMQDGHWAASVDLGSAHAPGFQVVGVGDFNHDGTSDVLWRDTTTGQVDLWIMQNGHWAASVDLGSAHAPGFQVVGVGDFNGDGTSDVLWRDATTGQVDLWIMQNGHWSASVDLGSAHAPGFQVVGVGDFNHDGTSDVLWRDATTGQVDLWIMQNGHWSASVDFGSTHAPGFRVVGVGDFNDDGNSDVLWRDITTGEIDRWNLANRPGPVAADFNIEGNIVPNVSVPVDTDVAANSVTEGAANGTLVGLTASSTNPSGAAVTYSLSDSAGGRFAINATTGVVTVAASGLVDFETSGSGHSYNITVQAASGSLVNSRVFTIGVNDVAPTIPTDANGATNTVAEGAANGTPVGITVSSTDVNGGTLTYSLTDNAGGRFAINASTGVVTVANSTLLDFETNTSHSITAQVSDGLLTASKSFTIAVSDVAPSTPVDNNGPTGGAVAEGAANGTAVGITALSTDANGPAASYTLTNNAGGRFAIDPTTGVVTVANAALIDFEASGASHSYTITARASAGALQSATQDFTITVTDVAPSAPADSNAAGNSVLEGSANGTLVGLTASASDPNGPAATFSLSDSAGGRFGIDVSTGVVTVANGSLIDFESAVGHAYSITVQATVGVLSSSQTFSIAVGDVAPAVPGDADGNANSVLEGAANGTPVGLTVSSSDVNGGTLTYSLTDSAGGRFAIDASTGVVTVANGALLDFETATSHSITAQVSDGTLTNSQTFAISVGDVAPSTPVDSNGSAGGGVTEGDANGTAVGVTAFSSDPNGPPVSYSLTTNAGGRFAIDPSTGIVTVANAALVDYESSGASHSYTITAQATAGASSSATQDFIIAVTNIAPTAPTDNDGAANSVAEGAAGGTTVGITASSTDINGPAVSYALVGDTSSGGFTIDSSTGVVSVANPAKIDYETSGLGHSYAITVQASDGAGGTSTQAFTIGVTNVPPTQPTDAVAPTGGTVLEGATTGALVGITAASTDVNGGTVTYRFFDTDPNPLVTSLADGGGRFQINSATGAISVSAFGAANIDYETAPGHAYSVTVEAFDGTDASATQTFTIDVTNAAPSTPADSDTANANTIQEGVASGVYTGLTAQSTDPSSASSQVTYSLQDTLGGRFAINATTGAISTGASANLIDFESSGGSYSLTVIASDNAGGGNTLTTSQTFTVAVTNANPATPSDGNPGTPDTVAEGVAAGQSTGLTVQSTDPGGGPALTYTLTDDAGGRFQIVDSATGVVTTGPNASLIDFESSGGSYQITAKADDGVGGTSTQTFTIAVSDVAPTTPTDVNGAADGVTEGAPAGTLVGFTAQSTDVNGGAVTYAFQVIAGVTQDAGGRFSINSSTGEISVSAFGASNIDFETSGGSYTVKVVANDGTLDSAPLTLVIPVGDVAPVTPIDNDPTADSGAISGSVQEGAAQNATVGIIALSTDVNGGTVTYALSNDAGGLFTIDTSGPTAGTVRVTAAGATGIDYESTGPGHTYSITVDATDGTQTSHAIFSITVTNVTPPAPTDSDAATETVADNASDGTPVGITLSSTDPNSPASVVTYALSDDAGRFQVDPSTGVVSVKPGHDPLVAGTAYTIKATATDGTGTSSESTFIINAITNNLSLDLDANNSAGIGGTGYQATFTEQGAAVAIADTDVAISNVNNPGANTVNSATVTLNNAQLNDALAINGALPAGITSAITTSAGKIIVTLTGPSTFANFQTALHQVVFSTTGNPDANAPNALDRSLTVSITDGTNTSTANSTIHVAPVNDAPDLTPNTPPDVGYIENAGPTALLATGAITDVDHPQTFATGSFSVAISSPPAGDQLVLLAASGFSATGSSLLFNGHVIGSISGLGTASVSVTGLTSFATPTVVNQLTHAFGYQSSSDNPSTAQRSVTFTFDDGHNIGPVTQTDSVIQHVNVTAVNDAPVAVADSYSTNEDTPLVVNAASGVLANDTDADTAPASLTAVLNVGPLNALSFTLNANGSFNYTPNSNFNGTDSFTYHTFDGALSSGIVTVTLTVNPQNDAPVLAPNPPSHVTYTENAAATQLFTTGSVTDADSPANFAGGSLSVVITNFVVGDELVLQPLFGFTLQGTSANHFTILQAGHDIGSLDLSVGGTASVTGLTAFATPGVVNQLVEAFGYRSSQDDLDATSRTVTFTFNDGGNSGGAAQPSNTITQTIDLTAVNDAPVNHAPAATQTVTAAGTLTFTALTPHSISVSDVDEPNNLTVTLTATNGTVTLSQTTGLTIDAGADGSATVTVTGSQSDINNALDGLVYTNDGTTGAATITIDTNDNDTTAPANASDSDIVNIDVVAASGATTPQTDLDGDDSTTALGSTGFITTFLQSASPVPVAIVDADVAITVSAPTSVTVVLTNAVDPDVLQVNGSAAATSTLTFGGTRQISWTTTDVDGSGQITVLLANVTSGADTPTADDYQEALKLVTFSTTDPSTVDRIVTVTAADAGGSGNTATTTIVIDDAPAVDLDGAGGTLDFATSYTENGTPASVTDTDVSITDADNTTLVSATVTITNHQANDVLSLNGPLPFGITASAYNASTGVLTLTSSLSNSLADYEAALKAVVFSNQSEAPSTTPRTVEITVNDGTVDSAVSTTTITVTAVNDAPVVTATALAAVNEDATNPSGETVANLFSGHFTDPDGTVATITGIAVSSNTANAGTQGAWQYSVDGGTNWFDVGAASDGAAVALDATTKLRFVPVADFNGAPPALLAYGLEAAPGGGFTTTGTPVTFDASVNGGSTTISDNAVAISTSVTAVNDAPALDLDTTTVVPTATGYAAAYTIGTTGVGIASANVGITDVDNTTLTSATITITTGKLASDFLSISGPLPAGITTTGYSSGTGVLTLTGTASLAAYQTALHQVVYSNGDGTVASGSRAITVQLDDGQGVNNLSNVATTTVAVTADSAPVGVDDTSAITAGTATVSANAITGAGTDTDAQDASALLTASAIRTGLEAGAGTSGTIGNALVGTYGALTLNWDGSYTYQLDNNSAAVQALGATDHADDFFTYTVRDTAGRTDLAQIHIDITGINDAPVANPDTASATEKGGAPGNAGTGGIDPSGNVVTNDTDPDGTTPTVSAVNGSGANVNNPIVSANNYGTLTLHTDGSYTYAVNNTNALVEALRTTAQTLTDTFNYTITDGSLTSSSTLTITIHGQNDNPTPAADNPVALEAGGTNNSVAGTNPSGNVLTNDTDVDTVANGETKNVVGVVGGDHTADVVPPSGNVATGLTAASPNDYGTLTVNSNGAYSYIVNQANTLVQQLNSTGHVDDIFTYTVQDAAGAQKAALITVTVNGSNDAPVAVNDGSSGNPGSGNAAYIAVKSTALTVNAASGVRANDTDIDNTTASLTVTKDTDPGHGTLTLNGDGSFTYTPSAGYLGTDSFTYHVTDPDPAGPQTSFNSNSATVFLDVRPNIAVIDNTGGGSGGSGTLADPFKTILDFNNANDAGHHFDIVYLKTGTGVYSTTDGINLRDGQTLLGEGVDLTYTTSASAPGGAQLVTLFDSVSNVAPIIQVNGGAGNAGVTLGQNNTLNGFNVAMNNADSVGIEDGNGTVGTLTVSGVAIGVDPDGAGALTGTLGKAIDIDQNGTLAATFSSIASSGSNSEGIQLGGTGGANTIGGTFAVTGTTSVTNAVGNAIHVLNTAAGASFNFGTSTTVNDTAVGGHTANGINLTTGIGNTNSFTFSSGGGALSVTTDGGYGLTASAPASPNGMTINLAGTSNSINATGGAGLDTTNASFGSGATFSTISSNAGANGISIVNPGASNVTVTGGTLSGHTANEINLNGGSGNFSFGGTINDGTGNSVTVNNRTGGTTTISGAINDGADVNGGIGVSGNSGGAIINFTGSTKTLNTGIGDAVSLSGNNGATINFTNGGLDIDTTNGSGFIASGAGPGATTGGTVNVTGTGNTINTTGTGTGLNILNTTIGASNLIFQSISVGNGADTAGNGIILNNTGSSGGLHVTGTDGADADTLADAGTGGTIQHKSGADGSTAGGIGIYLNNTSNVQLAGMNLHDFQNFGIFGTNVNNFDLTTTTVNATASATATNGTAQGSPNDESSILFKELTGTANFTNDTIAHGKTTDLEVVNNASGTSLTLNVSGSTFTGRDDAGLLATVQEILLKAGANPGDSPTITANFTNNTITNNDARGIQAIANGAATMNINIGKNNVAGSGGTFNGMPAAMIDLAHNSTGNYNFNIQNATFNVGNFGASVGASLPINIFNGTASGSATTFQGNVVQNTINGGNNPGGGFDGIELTGSGPGTMTVLVDHNTVNAVSGIGIRYTGAQNSATNHSNLTITNNTVNMPSNGNDSFGIQVSAQASATATSVVEANISGNNVTNDAASPDYRIDARFATSTLQMPGYGGGNSTANASAFVAANNKTNGATSTSAEVSASLGIGNVGTFSNTPGGAAVPLPNNPQPMLALDGGVASASATAGETNLSQSQLDTIVAAAIGYWAAAGASAAQIAALQHVTYEVGDAMAGWLAESTANHVLIDANASGHGWFVDPTPADSSEFSNVVSATSAFTDPTSAAAGHMDLLTVVAHEMGEQLGLSDQWSAEAQNNIMSVFLQDGERRLPSLADAGLAQQQDATAVAQAAEAALPAGAAAAVGTPIAPGGAGDDTFHIAQGGTVVVGGAGADAFVFEQAVLTTPAAQITHIADYSALQGDAIDVSALARLPAQVRVAEDASGAFATLQVDTGSGVVARGGQADVHWVGVAQLDGVHAGDEVDVAIDGTHALHQLHASWLA